MGECFLLGHFGKDDLVYVCVCFNDGFYINRIYLEKLGAWCWPTPVLFALFSLGHCAETTDLWLMEARVCRKLGKEDSSENEEGSDSPVSTVSFSS